MDNKHNPMDDWLREVERTTEFSYQESNWLRMAKRLDDEMPEKKRRFVFFSWPSMLILLLGAGIFGIASYSIRQHKQTSKTHQPISTIKKHDNKINENTLATPSTNGVSAETDNAGTSSFRSNTVTNKNRNNTISNEVKHTRKKSSSTLLTSDVLMNTTPSNKERISNSTSSSKHQAIHNDAPNKMVNPPTSSSYKRTNNHEMSISHEVDDRLTNKPILENNDAIQWVQGKPMQALDTQMRIQTRRMSNDDMIRYNPRYVHHLNQYEATRMDSITIIRYKPLQERTSYSTAIQPGDTFLNTFRLNLLVGSMLWRGFIGGNTWSPAPYISIGINKPLSAQLTLSAQVGFTYFAGLQTQNRSVSYRYKFGIDSTVYTALHKMVFRVQWPMQLTWAVNKNHAFVLGAGAAWQPDGISRVTAPAQVLGGGTAPSYNTPMQTKNQLGYLNGIKQWDGFVQLAYQYQWHERMALQLLWQAGMRDMTDNQILSSNRIQRNHGLMIGLRYGFVRNKQ